MTPGEIEAEIERHHAAGFAWALVCSGRNREEAEDVLQTAYLKVVDGRAVFAGHSSFKTFLFGVIRKTASEARRRNALRNLLLFRRGPGPEPPRPPAPEDRLALLAALSRLPRRQAQVLQLVFYVGLTVDEAADTLAISEGSARVHYDRGKKRIAALLGVARPGVTKEEEEHRA